MNSVQTVTQKQCTESKNWLGAPSAQPWPACTPRCSHGPARAPCRGRSGRPCRNLAWPCRRPRRSCRRPTARPAWPCRSLGRDTTRASSPPSGHDTNIVLRPIPLPILLLPCHDTPDCIVTHPASQASLLLCHNTIWCIATQIFFPANSPLVTIQFLVL